LNHLRSELELLLHPQIEILAHLQGHGAFPLPSPAGRDDASRPGSKWYANPRAGARASGPKDQTPDPTVTQPRAGREMHVASTTERPNQ
jgi:hypothetical protein